MAASKTLLNSLLSERAMVEWVKGVRKFLDIRDAAGMPVRSGPNAQRAEAPMKSVFWHTPALRPSNYLL